MLIINLTIYKRMPQELNYVFVKNDVSYSEYTPLHILNADPLGSAFFLRPAGTDGLPSGMCDGRYFVQGFRFAKSERLDACEAGVCCTDKTPLYPRNRPFGDFRLYSRHFKSAKVKKLNPILQNNLNDKKQQRNG